MPRAKLQTVYVLTILDNGGNAHCLPIEASSAKAAIRSFLADYPDATLIDCHMLGDEGVPSASSPDVERGLEVCSFAASTRVPAQ